MKILTQMVEQFRAKHQKLPEHIYVDPPALVVLSLRRAIAPTWMGIPVLSREIEVPAKPVACAKDLGVLVYRGELRSCDL